MDLNLSKLIATQIGALQHCCYRNAMLALLTLPQCAGWRYVEGWIITHEWPIEHGWLLLPIGTIVDPTLALFGERYINAQYFPGATFSALDVSYHYWIDQLREISYIPPISYRSSAAAQEHERARLLAYASRTPRPLCS